MIDKAGWVRGIAKGSIIEFTRLPTEGFEVEHIHHDGLMDIVVVWKTERSPFSLGRRFTRQNITSLSWRLRTDDPHDKEY